MTFASRITIVFLVAIIASVALVSFAHADGNEKCLASYDYSCPWGQTKNGSKCGMSAPCPYSQGSGICAGKNDCKATTAAGAGGGSMNIGDLSKLLGAIAQMMQALGAGAPAGGSPPASPSPSGTGNCTQYYSVTTPTSDPCAYYTPPTSGSINIDTNSNTNSSTGIDSIGSGSSVSSLIDILAGNTDQGTTSSSLYGNSTSTATSTLGVPTSASSTGPRPVLHGEIRMTPSGATVIVSSGPEAGNSVVAGFMGSEAEPGAQQGIIASWCRTRPWAKNFLSFIIPSAFFDGLCALKGYQVGMPQTVQNPQTVPTSLPKLNSKTGTSTMPALAPVQKTSVPVEARIWATPAAVPLGARTTIFWTSTGAVSCEETSPEGNFSQSTLSGGAATVPLSGPTTFTISCIAPDDTHVSDYVTVNLSL